MFLPPSALKVFCAGVWDASGMEEVCKPFSSINFFHLPVLAPELPESPRILGITVLSPPPSQPSSRTPLSGGATFILVARFPVGIRPAVRESWDASSSSC